MIMSCTTCRRVVTVVVVVGVLLGLGDFLAVAPMIIQREMTENVVLQRVITKLSVLREGVLVDLKPTVVTTGTFFLLPITKSADCTNPGAIVRDVRSLITVPRAHLSYNAAGVLVGLHQFTLLGQFGEEVDPVLSAFCGKKYIGELIRIIWIAVVENTTTLGQWLITHKLVKQEQYTFFWVGTKIIRPIFLISPQRMGLLMLLLGHCK